MRIFSKYWTILKEDKETGWCMCTDSDMDWDSDDCTIYLMNKKTNQEFTLSFEMAFSIKYSDITKESVIAGLESFFLVFSKMQPLKKCPWPFHD